MDAKQVESAEFVRAWEQEITLPTYPLQTADPNPMFLEKRVYQGSSGKVYPNPFTDRVSTEKSDKIYRAVMLENEYVQLMILPEIGGRIHVGFDKTNGYDFFYRQHVIKPALVGLLGPWISGGVEFNWPQHHRPSTYMPVHFSIERSADGSCTVWLSEHDPMSRQKGMVGICLYPGKSIIEAKVRLFNRTSIPQTFLWWANVGVRTHDQYQSFFPPDVYVVADHARRAMTSFPIAHGVYYGVDYSKGVDLSWYKNIPIPTSYMVTKSKYDFMGGYDHAKEAGFVHVASHFVAPGKKQWTWGNADFGYAWDRNLTDEDGPYIELMAGAYTDNQPDFSWLQPYETKTFSQFWYPIQNIGPAKNANVQVAISLDTNSKTVRIGVCATQRRVCRVTVYHRETILFDRTSELAPGRSLVQEVAWDGGVAEDLKVEVRDQDGNVLLDYQPEPINLDESQELATEPGSPSEISSNEELYLIGLHLEQYRHATRSPELYWREGLRRDPHDVRLNNAVGLLELRRGRFEEAEKYFNAAIHRLTARNPNPYDSEPYYNLGLTLKYLGRESEAYAAFYKSVWNYAWQSPGYYQLAAIDAGRGRAVEALENLERSLQTNTANFKARGLKASILRRTGKLDAASQVITETLLIDPLEFRSISEKFFLTTDSARAVESLVEAFDRDIQTSLDIAYDYMAEGLLDEALRLLQVVTEGTNSRYPMLFYTMWWLALQLNEKTVAQKYALAARGAPSLYCFPARLEEMLILEAMLKSYPDDAKAAYYLGNLYYDKQRHDEAISCWNLSVQLDSSFSIPWRNLGIAEFNIHRDPTRALQCYAEAFAANPSDARLLYEWDQLKKRVGVMPAERLAILDRQIELVAQRDDLVVEYCTLLNQCGDSQRALDLLLSRRFSPWEGGEGLVSRQFVQAQMKLGQAAMNRGDFAQALAFFSAARCYPHTLGEGKHLLTLEREIDYFSARAAQMLGDIDSAQRYYRAAAASLPEISWYSYYQALALRQIGCHEESDRILKSMRDFGNQRLRVAPQIDYFATSLPNFLLFEDDLQKRNEVESLFLLGLADRGLGNRTQARNVFLSVMEKDHNHMGAQEQLEMIDREIEYEAASLPLVTER